MKKVVMPGLKTESGEKRSGIELLQERLVEEGFAISKIASNKELIFAVLNIVAESDETLHRAVEDEINYLQAAQARAREDSQSYHDAEQKYLDKSSKLWAKEEEYDEVISTKAAVDELKEQLMQAETPEARDMIRRFFVYKNNCVIKTVYDNTAFIKGAGAILSDKKNWEIKSEQKRRNGIE